MKINFIFDIFQTKKKLSVQHHLPLRLQVLIRYTLSGILGAIAFILKVALAVLPNVELATFVIALTCVFFTVDIAFLVINAFCSLNIVFFGIAEWSLLYFVIFNFYGILSILLRKWILKWWWIFIIVVALMGYCFGALFAIDKIFLFSLPYAITWWIAGLWFDFIHGTANFLLGLMLYWPILKVFQQLKIRYDFCFNNTFLTLPKKT